MTPILNFIFINNNLNQNNHSKSSVEFIIVELALLLIYDLIFYKIFV